MKQKKQYNRVKHSTNNVYPGDIFKGSTGSNIIHKTSNITIDFMRLKWI